ncbi:Peroxidase [Rhynchospora pubera]|uniref:Peroxidase n=1 Tax=Rhynchospora pubera TaxID=906938 RepID=A0AAV8E342_9POAL|nr:Peroxidase [Rhynchospora pubera]
MHYYENPRKVPQDHVTPDVLDVQYYTNVLNNRVLFFCDYSLSTDPVAKATMQLYSTDFENVLWRPKFIATMQKLSQFKVLTGTQGQIRKACSAVN